jgi:hypothetical protein
VIVVHGERQVGVDLNLGGNFGTWLRRGTGVGRRSFNFAAARRSTRRYRSSPEKFKNESTPTAPGTYLPDFPRFIQTTCRLFSGPTFK